MNELRGILGFKGERGFSAYEVAVQNGFVGTEQDWLATLGTSQHVAKVSIEYVTTKDNETQLDLPNEYMPNESMLDIYVEGKKVYFDRYSIDYSNKKINLLDNIPNAGEKIEIVVFTFSSNSLPIVETIDDKATNETTAGTKAIYDFVKEVENKFNEEISKINDKFVFDTTIIEVEEE